VAVHVELVGGHRLDQDDRQGRVQLVGRRVLEHALRNGPRTRGRTQPHGDIWVCGQGAALCACSLPREWVHRESLVNLHKGGPQTRHLQSPPPPFLLCGGHIGFPLQAVPSALSHHAAGCTSIQTPRAASGQRQGILARLTHIKASAQPAPKHVPSAG